MSDKLLARSRVLTHPSGVKVTTPLLVPSFSSKGVPATRDGKPWVTRILEITAEWLTDTMLLSAYDVAHGHVPPLTDLPCTPELTIIDSGGYEAGLDQDLSAAVLKEHRPEPWKPEGLRDVLDSWPNRFAAAFVSYDHPNRRLPLQTQVAEAHELFGRYPKQMHSFLLKPMKRDQSLLKATLEEVSQEPTLLKGFDMIGVTEKELGRTILDRMQRIAELRLALDAAGLAAPIHVFGALDPLSSSFYFISGAEVFDGLTWLRYAYFDGACGYRANYGALRYGVQERDDLVEVKTMTDNVNYLRGLELSMKRVALDDTVAHFDHHSKSLRTAFGDLRARLKGRI